MRVDEMISRATHTSGRSVLTISSLVVASNMFDFDLKALPLFNQGEIPEPALQKIALSLILVLTLAHILNWLNDLNGYLLNDKRRIVNDQSELHNFLTERWSQYNRSATEAGSRHSGPPDFDRFLEYIRQDGALNIKVLWMKSDYSEKLALFVQHFSFPIGFACWSTYLLLFAIFK